MGVTFFFHQQGFIDMYAAPVYGAPVYGGAVYSTPASVPYGGVVPGYTPGVAVAANSAHALALDAADGVIDGRIGGAPIVGGGAVYGAPVVAPAPVVYASPAVVPTTHYGCSVTYY